MTASAGLIAHQASIRMKHRMMKLSMTFATVALVIAASAPSFADNNTTAADSSRSHNADTDAARSNAPHTSGRTGVSTPSDSRSAGTITNGQSAQMPTRPLGHAPGHGHRSQEHQPIGIATGARPLIVDAFEQPLRCR